MLLRKLGSCEKLAYLLEQQSCCNFTIVADTTLLNATIFNKAAELTLSQHPLLKAEIIYLNDEPWFNSTEKNTFEISHLYNIKEINLEIESSLSNSFNSKSPPFVKIKCFHTKNETKILLTFYHVVSDASAGLCFLSDTLSFYNTLSSDKKQNIIPYPLKNSVESLINSNNDIESLTYNRTFSENKSPPIKQPSFINISTVSIHLPLGNIQLLLQNSEYKNLTIHQILSAAAAFSIKTENKSISLVTPVNIRKLLNPEIKPQEFGYYLSRTDINVIINNSTTLSELARKIKSESDTQLSKNYVLSTIEILGELAENTVIESGLNSTSETPMILLSNIGQVDALFNIHENIKLYNVQYYMAPQAISLNCQSYCLAITTYKNILNINISYNKDNISEKSATAFSEKFKDLLTHS